MPLSIISMCLSVCGEENPLLCSWQHILALPHGIFACAVAMCMYHVHVGNTNMRLQGKATGWTGWFQPSKALPISGRHSDGLTPSSWQPSEFSCYRPCCELLQASWSTLLPLLHIWWVLSVLLFTKQSFCFCKPSTRLGRWRWKRIPSLPSGSSQTCMGNRKGTSLTEMW